MKKSKIIGITLGCVGLTGVAVATPLIVTSCSKESEKVNFPNFQNNSNTNVINEMYNQIQNYINVQNITFGDKNSSYDISHFVDEIWNNVKEQKLENNKKIEDYFTKPKYNADILFQENGIEFEFGVIDYGNGEFLQIDNNNLSKKIKITKEKMLFQKINIIFVEPSVERTKK